MMVLVITIILSILTTIESRNERQQGNNGIGHICEKNNPCVNGATCGYTRGGYICKCTVGWQGENCDEDIDECANFPCNQGRCINGEGSYSCDCPSGWSGARCEIDVNECETDSLCNSVGTNYCLNTQGSYNCNCKSGYTGQNCDEDIDECLSNPCRNDGVCVNSPGSFICRCEQGWTGTLCEQDIDECLGTNPCATSTNCVNTPGSYTCVCYGSLTEPNCAAAGTTMMVCEGGTVNIRCPRAKIQIQQASYGRSERNVCPHHMIQTTDCRAPRSKAIVMAKCEGRGQCSLTAANGDFGGDPCPNTYKYLRVKYICIE